MFPARVLTTIIANKCTPWKNTNNLDESLLECRTRDDRKQSSQTRDLHRNSNMIFPLTPPCRQAAKHWQRRQAILPTLKARGWSVSRWEFDVRSEISVFIPKWHSLCIFPIVILCCKKCWDVNTMRQHPRNLPCRCQTAWFEVNWKTDARARSWLQERLSSYICIPSQCDTLNTWLERLTETTKIQKLPTDTTLFLSRLRVGCQSWDVCLHVRFRFPLCLSFRHFSRHQLSKHFTLLETRRPLSCRRYSTWYEADQKQRWDLDLDSRIRFPLTPSYPHITMQPFAHLAWTPGRENKNPETSTDKVEFATLKSQMSEVRCRSSYRSQIPTVSLLSSFSATTTYEMLTRWKRIHAIVRVGASPSGTKRT